MIWLLLAVVATYMLPPFFPDPSLAFYILHGWEGCLFIICLYRKVPITASGCVVLSLWESSGSVCGSLYAAKAPDVFGSLCDKGSGLPLTLPLLAVTLIAMLTASGLRSPEDQNG